jgi:hypothetical protein
MRGLTPSPATGPCVNETRRNGRDGVERTVLTETGHWR